MHLLATQQTLLADGAEAVDLCQSPADIIIISAADTELTLLAHTYTKYCNNLPTLRLANALHLSHNMSVDLYTEKIVKKAKLVIVRLLGGRNYWPYGVDEISRTCQNNKILCAFLPGDDQPDPELSAYSSLPTQKTHKLWQYSIHGGPSNAENFLKYAGTLIGYKNNWLEPQPLLKTGLYWPKTEICTIEEIKQNWVSKNPLAAIVFYRALVQSGMTEGVDALIKGLIKVGLNPLPIFAQSLKDPLTGASVDKLILDNQPDIILSAVGFAVSSAGIPWKPGPLDSANTPILQVGFASSSKDDWAKGFQGLSSRDITMNVALTEIDGRVFTRAVSFKSHENFNQHAEFKTITHKPLLNRINFVSKLAANWVKLRNLPNQEKKIAVIFANYPNKDARLGNGVGLDTPASALTVLKALKTAKYKTGKLPKNANEIIKLLKAGPTNNFKDLKTRTIKSTLPINTYKKWFGCLPKGARSSICTKWGLPEDDPYFLKEGYFAISVYCLGHIAIGLQPARGYNIDPVKTYHDPDLVPPHGYLAFYCWLQCELKVHAIVHMGKHGNLEWLPGKAVALSAECFPEVAFGPIPHIYPFIVNDPGEGTQAKRRSQAVIIDHLTPPLTRAESYGPLRDLEVLVDEYYEASGTHPARAKILKQEILLLCQSSGIDIDCNVENSDSEEIALSKIDNYLCELKEIQIRDGLHIFGNAPKNHLLTDLIVCLARLQRGDGVEKNNSLHRAIAKDLRLTFDPLNCNFSDQWTQPKPEILQNMSTDLWRTHGDSVERIEILAKNFVSREVKIPTGWSETNSVIEWIEKSLRPLINTSGKNEIISFLTGLNGQFVEPGPSGAPTRGRPDVLPTGRNFYSIDTRVVPTAAAWRLGWKSASLLIDRYMQDNGHSLRAIALSAWGTSNMRTGGEDLAQALALMGVKPTWDDMSRRVIGFEVIPISVLGRPRVDVTLRVSGFFRDSFSNLIDLFDSASQSVGTLEEPADMNPLAARVKSESQYLVGKGMRSSEAIRSATYRVFGSKPGTYGAGLQALIDEQGWKTEDDLAQAYITWAGYAYGVGNEGIRAHKLFKKRLKVIDAVCHNQDNREHDLLDSDDYYQFEGGLTAAVRYVSNKQPQIYHNDHSRPESPQIRTLEEEIGRVVRARVVNPKWLSGVMRHGYKGAFEMAATVDYLFAFAATTHCVANHHFDLVFESYIEDKVIRNFFNQNNIDALSDIAKRLLEAQDRGIWSPRSNSARNTLKTIIKNKQ